MNIRKKKKGTLELVYGEYLYGNLVFLEKEAAELWAKINDAVDSSRDSDFVWGEFKLKYPYAYKWFEEYFGWDMNFKEWYEENKDYQEWESLKEAKDDFEYEFSEWRGNGPPMRMKLDLPENYQESLTQGHNLGAQSNAFLPNEILEKFGTYDWFVEKWNIDPKEEKEIVSELNAHGYVCKRDSDMICKACTLW